MISSCLVIYTNHWPILFLIVLFACVACVSREDYKKIRKLTIIIIRILYVAVVYYLSKPTSIKSLQYQLLESTRFKMDLNLSNEGNNNSL